MDYDPPATFWNDDMQDQWEEFWTRVMMHQPDKEGSIVVYEDTDAAVNMRLFQEFQSMVLEMSPYRFRKRKAPGDSLIPRKHMGWVRRMLVQSIPPAHAELVRRGLLAGEGARLLDGTLRLGIFIMEANSDSAKLRQSERVLFRYTMDGSEVFLELTDEVPFDVISASAPSLGTHAPPRTEGESESD